MAFKSIWSSASLMGVGAIANPADESLIERLTPCDTKLSVAFLDEDRGLRQVKDCSKTPLGDLEAALKKALELGSIYMSIDTYMLLALHHEIVADHEIAGVFPYPADKVCESLPPISPAIDATCRKVARYYFGLFHKRMIDWNNRPQRFRYKAANTVSFRAGAPYQAIKREQRAMIRPFDHRAKVLQFDWTAAEWTLILQHCGYHPQQDAYEAFTATGIDRDAAKKIVLPTVYSARAETLYQANGVEVVDRVIKQMATEYPKVVEWSQTMRHSAVVNFEGYLIDLGPEDYIRPNRWAQTALQLCKWDLISRIVDRGLIAYGAGDLHDQLYFDFVPEDPASKAGAVMLIEEIQRPCFGRYKLPARLESGDHWK